LGLSPDDRRKAVALGEEAERVVARRYERDGWTVLAHRWMGGGAEVDLIVRDVDRLRFVEVKLRKPEDPVGFEAVDARKVARLRRAGDAFLVDYQGAVREACIAVALVACVDGRWSIDLLDDAV